MTALLAQSQPVKAATSPPASAELEEVVVTAERRSANIMTIPVQVTAISANQLRETGVTQLRDLTQLSPALTYGTIPNGSPSAASFIIRGVAPVTTAQNVDPAVGVYIDGMYMSRSEGGSIGLVDIGQVEVLEGPQGTLFGRNTIAGAITIETNKPVLDQFSGQVKATVGNYATYGAQVVANLPVLENRLALRFVYDHLQHGGYQPDPTVGHNVYSQKSDYIRLGVTYTPVDNVKINEMADWAYISGLPRQHTNFLLDPTIALSSATSAAVPVPPSVYVPASIAPPGTNWTYAQWNPKVKGRTFSSVTTAAWEQPWATLKSISAYRQIAFHSPTDVDASAGQNPEYLNGEVRQWQVSQELQAYGDAFDNRLSWIGGLYFFEEHIGTEPGNGDPNVSRITNRALTTHFVDGLNISKSLYGQLTFKVLPNLRVRGGARYTWDSRKLAYISYAISNYFTAPVAGCFTPFTNAGGVTLSNGQVLPNLQSGYNPATGQGLNGGQPCLYQPHRVSFHYIPWTTGIDWQPTPNLFVYGTVSKGYHSGGFQQTAISDLIDQLQFDPESALNYEFGVKADLLDRRLRVTATAYQMDYRKMLILIQRIGSTGSLFNTLANAGNGRLQGLEFSGEARLDRLRLSASAAFQHNKFVRTNRNGGIVVQGGPLGNALFNANSLADNGVPFFSGYHAPNRSFNLAADYRIDTPFGVLTPHADYQWNSASYNASPFAFQVVNGVTQVLCVPCGQGGTAALNVFNLQRIPARGILNLRATLDVDDRWRVEVYGRNVTNKIVPLRTLRAGAGALSALMSDPRTYGMAVTSRF